MHKLRWLVLDKTGAAPLARLSTEYAENNFPALPVRTGGHVYAWFASFAGAEEHREHEKRLTQLPEWTDEVRPRLQATECLRLEPTPRSMVR